MAQLSTTSLNIQSQQTQRLLQHLLCFSRSERRLIAIAGAPGSGKSTLAHWLCDALNQHRPKLAAVLPMDGFHYDDAVLNEKGVYSRKGAPFTFDVGGLSTTLQRLKQNDEFEVAVPVFDREMELSRGSARVIAQATSLILVEGNYLLLNREPWCQLAKWFDYRVMIHTPIEELEQRLLARWLKYGYSPKKAQQKANHNDLPNARLVVSQSQQADFNLQQED